jgi:hypothetical protein
MEDIIEQVMRECGKNERELLDDGVNKGFIMKTRQLPKMRNFMRITIFKPTYWW